MKGIFNGVLNCTHCSFSLNRQNYGFPRFYTLRYKKKIKEVLTN